MGWVRVDDSFYDHPKFIEAGTLASMLWLHAVAWSNRNLSDGFIPERKLPGLLDLHGIGEANDTKNDDPVRLDCCRVHSWDLAERLVNAGLWHAVPGGYEIHDYADFQKTAAQIKAERDKERKRWERRSTRRSTPESARSRAGAGVEDERSADATQPQPQRDRDKSLSLAQRLSQGCGFPVDKCQKLVDELHDEGIGDIVIDMAIGQSIGKARSLSYVGKVARDWFAQRTGGS